LTGLFFYVRGLRRLIFLFQASDSEQEERQVSKPEWGTKRICQQCATRFYDMKKKPPICPKCGASIELESPKAKRARAAAEEKARRTIPTPEIDEIPIENDGAEDTMIEDVDELGEDDLDMDDVVERKEDDQ
jgi:uncharacterized protein (TIGR02300 family)